MGQLAADLPEGQPLLHSLASLLAELWDGEHSTAVIPTALLQCIRKANPTFRNQDQHDAHELLR